MRIAIYNNKGGVGKTTTAVNLGAALARLGHRTLVVDMDPQSHVAGHFGLDPEKIELAVEDALQQRKPTSFDEILVEVTENLWIAPCTEGLNGTRSDIDRRINSTTVLNGRLQKMSTEFDYVIFDTPPDRGVFSRNAMYAAEVILVPINLERFAVDGMDPVMDEIGDLQDAYEERGWTIRIAILRYDGRLKQSNQICGDQIAEIFGEVGYVLESYVRTDARVGAAQTAGLSIFDYDVKHAPAKNPTSKASADYLAMAREFVELARQLGS